MAEHGADMQQLATRENIFVDELAHAGAHLPVLQVACGDAVVQDQAARRQQTHDLAKVGVHVGLADVLEHADRRYLVERPRFRQVAVVAQFNAHPALQALGGDQLAHMRILVGRQRDAGRINAVMLGSPQQQRAPAGADVQETLARLEHQLAADVVELGLLRLRQGHAAVAVIGA